jgi:hypothetical protein
MHERAQALSKGSGRPELRGVLFRYLRTGASEERFLSYQAPKPNAQLTSVGVRGGGVHFMLPLPIGADSAESRSALAIINDDCRYKIAVEWILGMQTEILMPMDRFRDVDREGVLESARQLWRHMGATNAEAVALVKSCETELLETPGLLGVYPLTPKQVEADLSLSVEPAPTEIFRCAMILEAIGWKPGQSR